jgi:hypothetical protein
VPRYRLRYLATDLELPLGEFVIGRSSACNLALDDALVSRRHAMLTVTADAVTAQDLGSRNGILVNGERIDGPQPIKHLDRVTIGSQDMVLIEVGRSRRSGSPETGEALPCPRCGHPIHANEAFCKSCGAAAPREGRTLAGATMELKMPIVPGAPHGEAKTADEDEATDDVTRQQSGLALLASIANKALALKRFDEAERILGKHLLGLLEKARRKLVGSEDLVRDATGYALSLAEGLGKPRWVDWVFEMNAATRVVLTAADVERLHKLVRQINYDDPKPLRAYLAVIAPLKDRMSAADRFVLQRLEGLERVISA